MHTDTNIQFFVCTLIHTKFCMHSDTNIQIFTCTLIQTYKFLYAHWYKHRIFCMHTDTYKCLHAHWYKHTNFCMHTDTNIQIFVCTLIQTYRFLHAYWYKHTNFCTHTDTNIQIFTCTLIHTNFCKHTDTNIQIFVCTLIQTYTLLYAIWTTFTHANTECQAISLTRPHSGRQTSACGPSWQHRQHLAHNWSEQCLTFSADWRCLPSAPSAPDGGLGTSPAAAACWRWSRRQWWSRTWRREWHPGSTSCGDPGSPAACRTLSSTPRGSPRLVGWCHPEHQGFPVFQILHNI